MKLSRKKIICVLICGLFFTKFFVDLTNKYLKYETVTNFHLYDNIETEYKMKFETCENTTINGATLKQYLRANYEELDIKIHHQNDKLIEFNISLNFSSKENIYFTWEDKYGCYRLLQLEMDQKIDGKNYHSNGTMNRGHLVNHFYIGIKFYLSRLQPAPYDTDCIDYGIVYQKGSSHLQCKNSIQKYLKPPCIMFDTYRLKVWNFNISVLKLEPMVRNFIVAYEQSVEINYQSYLTLDTYFFCAFGLVAIFIEFAVFDALTSSIKLMKICFTKYFKFNFPTKIRKYFNSFKIIVVIIGVVIHENNILQKYFRYDHSTQANFGKPLALNIPRLSICIPIDKLKEHNFNHNNLSFNQIESKTRNLSYVIQKLRSGTREYNLTYKTFFWNDNKCFRIGDHLGKIDKEHHLHYIYFHDNRSEQLLEFSTLFAQDKNELAFGYPFFSSGLLGKADGRRFYKLGFVEYKLLPEPYETKCVDNIKSSCINNCKISLLNGSKQATNDVFIFKSNFGYTSTQNDNSANIKKCQNICKYSACDSTTWYAISYQGWSKNQLAIGHPWFGTQIHMLEHMSLSNLAIYCFSVFGFWTGIELIVEMIKYFRNYYKNYLNYQYIAFILFVYHMIFEFENYLKYEMVTKISFAIEDYSIPNILLVKFCSIKYFEDGTSSSPFMIDQECGNHTAIKSLAIMDSFEVEMNIYVGTNLSDIAKKAARHIFLNENQMEIKIDSLNLEPIRNLDGRIYQPVFQVNFTNDNYKGYYFYLRHEKAYDLGRPLRKENFLKLTRQQLLPPPYETNCKIVPVQTYAECYENQLKKQNLSCNMLCSLPVTYNSTLMRYNSTIHGKIQTYCQYIEAIKCLTYNYQPVLKKFSWSPILDKHSFDVNIFVETNSNCIFSPMISLTTFIMILAGIFNLWFGVNLFWIMNLVADETKPRLSKYSSWIIAEKDKYVEKRKKKIEERNKKKVRVVNVWRASDLTATTSETPMAFTIRVKK